VPEQPSSHALTSRPSRPSQSTSKCLDLRSRNQGILMSPVLTGPIPRKRKRICSKPRRPTNYMRLEMLSALPPPSQVSPGHSLSKPSQALTNDYADDGRINVSLTSKSPAKLAELLHLSRTPVSAVHEPVPNNGSWRCPRLNIVIHVVGSRGTSLQQPQSFTATHVLTGYNR
jgi:hypothetical protein